MLIAEARWLGRKIFERPAPEVFPMLNVGSSTEVFRTKEQPWIDRHIFAPARAKGLSVTHLDIRDDPGVDLVGDLSDASFLARLRKERFSSVLCSNLLEHVINPGEIAEAVVSVVPAGGYLFVSCPYRFPYHPDPIDTGFRPNVAELAALFPGTDVAAGEIVDCGTFMPYFLRDMTRKPGAVIRSGVRRLIAPRATAGVEERAPADIHENLGPWLFKKMEATCVLLRKRPHPR
jgi:hypothetical protein